MPQEIGIKIMVYEENKCIACDQETSPSATADQRVTILVPIRNNHLIVMHYHRKCFFDDAPEKITRICMGKGFLSLVDEDVPDVRPQTINIQARNRKHGVCIRCGVARPIYEENNLCKYCESDACVRCNKGISITSTGLCIKCSFF